MTAGGWFRLPRAVVREIRCYDRHDGDHGHAALSLFVEICDRAAYNFETFRSNNYGPVPLQRGQCVVSRRSLAETLGLDPSFVYRCLQKWQSRGYIRVEPIPVSSPSRSTNHLPSLVTLLLPEFATTTRLAENQSTDHVANHRPVTGEPMGEPDKEKQEQEHIPLGMKSGSRKRHGNVAEFRPASDPFSKFDCEQIGGGEA